ncbi:dihydrolipoyl dehydrogenase [Paludibacter sp. 221]|uniref:dihydrolipoyl dehydrogenase n=1 Tax=Paludibacter sp. 221 TaxID=2302939 RepID=UPI0013D6493D|nr:dihydrolipoyl dehydrogenase [Paludibacter sp. 221]NDV47166.1 dihydrolipoyl dehydrogenase [Paludibacter sp. 221]
MHDLGIIGGGPAGYTAAEHAAKLGLTVVLFEKGDIGGVCLNEGCIPTKTLLYSAKLYENARNASKYGISAENVGFGYEKIIARKNKVVRKLNAGVRAKLNHENITVVKGDVQIQEKKEKEIEIHSNGENYTVKSLLICSGSENIMPPIPGLSAENMWTSREALQSKEQPESLVVIGGGVIGMEFAGFFNTLGTQVTVIEMQDEILGNMDKEINHILREEYTKKGITFHVKSKVLEVKGDEVFFEKDGEVQFVKADKILLSVGRRPNSKGFGLENLGVELSKNGGIVVDERMQTSVPGVFAAGDVTGFSMLAHTAVREAEVAVNFIRGEYDSMSYKAIPGVVYTNPEVAGVGATEEVLRANGVKYQALRLPMTFSGRFVAENEGGSGLCKILVDEDSKICGVHMIGNPSSEIITLATLAIEQGMSVEQWEKSVFPHPTVSEIIKETLLTFEPETVI